MKKLSTVGAVLLFLASALPMRSQTTNLTFDEVVTLIETLRAEKRQDYSPETTGVLLHNILDEMLRRYNYRVFTINTHYVVWDRGRLVRDEYEPQDHYGDPTDGLKKRLFHNMSSLRMKLLANTLSDPRERKLLALMYYTRQASVSAFITDRALRHKFDAHGRDIRIREYKFWRARHKLITNPTNNLMSIFQEYPPELSARLANLVAQTSYRNADRDYESTWISWASASLNNAYYQMRQVELAWRSVPLKLLDEEGYFPIPEYTKAEFIWSGSRDRILNLSFTHWTTNDVPTLLSLRTNEYYGVFAERQLVRMRALP